MQYNISYTSADIQTLEQLLNIMYKGVFEVKGDSIAAVADIQKRGKAFIDRLQDGMTPAMIQTKETAHTEPVVKTKRKD